jgi:hypothetical protein
MVFWSNNIAINYMDIIIIIIIVIIIDHTNNNFETSKC